MVKNIFNNIVSALQFDLLNFNSLSNTVKNNIYVYAFRKNAKAGEKDIAIKAVDLVGLISTDNFTFSVIADMGGESSVDGATNEDVIKQLIGIAGTNIDLSFFLNKGGSVTNLTLNIIDVGNVLNNINASYNIITGKLIFILNANISNPIGAGNYQVDFELTDGVTSVIKSVYITIPWEK